MHRDGAELLAVIELQTPMGDGAKTVRFLQDRVEHRRKVARRGVDDLQHLSGRRLALQCFARLGDEPGVFHRDHRLRGEVFEERYLFVSEGPHFPPLGNDLPE